MIDWKNTAWIGAFHQSRTKRFLEKCGLEGYRILLGDRFIIWNFNNLKKSEFEMKVSSDSIWFDLYNLNGQISKIFPLRKQIFIWFWCLVQNRTVILSEIMSWAQAWGMRSWSFWLRIRLCIFRNNRRRSSAARFGQNRLVFIIKFIFAKKFWPWFLKFDKIFIFCFVIVWFSYRFLTLNNKFCYF